MIQAFRGKQDLDENPGLLRKKERKKNSFLNKFQH
jgi:hypothetical protein